MKTTPPHIHNAAIHWDSRTNLFQGSKQEDQHTRKTLGTLSRVYKPGDNPIVLGASNPCWSYQSQDLRPTKTMGVEMHIPLPKCDSFADYVWHVVPARGSMTTTSQALIIEGIIRLNAMYLHICSQERFTALCLFPHSGHVIGLEKEYHIPHIGP